MGQQVVLGHLKSRLVRARVRVKVRGNVKNIEEQVRLREPCP